MRAKAADCLVSVQVQSCLGVEKAHINNRLELAKDGGNWLSNDGDGLEEASLSDQDVEKHLVDADKLAEGVGDGLPVGVELESRGGNNLRDGGSGDGDDLSETLDDLLAEELIACHLEGRHVRGQTGKGPRPTTMRGPLMMVIC